LRLQPLQVFLFRERTNHAEADKLGVGQPPDALRALGILLDPGLVGTAPRRAPQTLSWICPRASADDMRETVRRGQEDGLKRRLIDAKRPVVVLLVVIETPLRYIAMHVVQSPWIWLLLTDGVS